MNKQVIFLQNFVLAFQKIVDESIWRVIHPADGWLTIDLGQKYTDTLPGTDGQDEPYIRGQHQIHITGDWEIYTNDKLIESRKVHGDDRAAYFNRMEQLADNFPLTQVQSVILEEGQLLIKDGQSKISIPVSETLESLSLSSVELDANHRPIAYTHYRFDEELGKLVAISVK
ncbi:MAG: hypothetical protein GX559_03520 [Candidatus Pacebacteria bacterium]|nr:hypothetical protein [Candidatus Paceibacterota bacterium]